MKKRTLTTTFVKDGAWYVASCVELGVTTQGRTLEEAENNLREAVALYVEDLPKEECEQLDTHSLIRTLDIDFAF